MRVVEDPSIAWAAFEECERVWKRIESTTAAGTWFFEARERILAEEVPKMVKLYGAATASRVSKVIQSRDYRDLSAGTLRAIRDRPVPGVPPRPPGLLARLLAYF